MNFSSLLLEYLKKHGDASLYGFGTFYLKNSNAVLDESGKSILPPGKEIAFRTDSGKNGEEFVKFISVTKNITEFEAALEIKKHINFWNLTLDKDQKITIENVGTFFLTDSTIYFSGERTENISLDFYGLEQITISDIKSKPDSISDDTTENSYRFTKSVYWLVPLIIGILALTYFGITQPEKIFGRKSFGEDYNKKKTEKTMKNPVTIDSTRIKNSSTDSVSVDTIRSAVNSNTAPL